MSEITKAETSAEITCSRDELLQAIIDELTVFFDDDRGGTMYVHHSEIEWLALKMLERIDKQQAA